MKNILILIFILLLFEGTSHAVRIKDITTINGVRENKLIGYGLIVGLNGTGDKAGTEFTIQSLVSMLKKQGISIRQEDVKVKNVAAVMVSAELPPFVETGSYLDVTISSIGDATSLQGGTLIMTPLRGPDGHIYAVAQGSISLGGFVGGAGGDSVQKNHPTVGRISGGAIVEKKIENQFLQKDRIIFNLSNADFVTIQRMAERINRRWNKKLAFPLNSSSLEVMIPDDKRNQIVEFISATEVLEIEVDQKAKVVLNERTGTVIMGERVTLSTVAISHGNLTIEINTNLEVSQPNPFAKGETVIVPETNVSVIEEGAKLLVINASINIGQVVAGLNAIGVTPRDLIAILQAMKAAGALQAELEII